MKGPEAGARARARAAEEEKVDGRKENKGSAKQE